MTTRAIDDRFRTRAKMLIHGSVLALAGCVVANHSNTAKPNEAVEVRYRQPSLKANAQGSETQTRGSVVVQMTPVPVTPVKSTVRSCKRIDKQESLADMFKVKVANSQEDLHKVEYEVRETPRFVVPKDMQFSVHITNRSKQVIKLSDTIPKLNVNSSEVALGTGTFLQGVIPPGHSSSFLVDAPDWDAFPSGANLLFSLYGVPTQMDKAGNVVERENFEWLFTLDFEDKVEQADETVSSEWLLPQDVPARCAAI